MCFVKPKPFLYQVEKDKCLSLLQGSTSQYTLSLGFKIDDFGNIFKRKRWGSIYYSLGKKNSKGELGSYEKERKETR